jgi:glutamine amidotransferase
MVHPVIDEYYNYNPYHKRSSKLVQDKGLVTNEKNTPATTPGVANGQRAKSNVSSLHESIASTLVPAMHSSSISPRSVSPMLSPAQENTPINDLRQVISNLTASARDPTRPQELGNTKKKRKSLSSRDATQIPQEDSDPVPDSPPPRAAYGDPLKIAQYFPELN